MNLKIAFSPCPNDTYMVYHLIHRQVSEFNFEPTIADVEELNTWALDRAFDVTKISFRTFYDVCETYDLLSSGSALGHGNGPLLISKRTLSTSDLSRAKIAVPGLQTTATFLLDYAYGQRFELVPMLFSDIESAIIEGQVEAGVIIHETRFLYKERGLVCLRDLGEAWEEGTNLPIPLGGFAIRKDLPLRVKQCVAEMLRASIQYADQNPSKVGDFVKSYAKELDDLVISQHIDMFVNEFSKDLGPEGRKSIGVLFDVLNRTNKKSRHYSIV